MKSVSTKPCKRVETKDLSGKKNGFLLEIASTRDGWSKFLDNSQVYLATVLPKQKKGFHLHHKKVNQFTCIKGNVAMAVWEQGKNFLRDNLKLYRFLSIKMRTLLGLYNPIIGLHPADIGNVEFDQMAVSREERPDRYEEALEKTQIILLKIKKLLDEKGVDFVLVLIPHPHMVNGNEWSKGRKTFGFEVGKTYSDRSFIDLSIWGESVGIEVVNLLPYLKVISAEKRLYFNIDGHFNPKGHQAVAKALVTLLTGKLEKR